MYSCMWVGALDAVLTWVLEEQSELGLQPDNLL